MKAYKFTLPVIVVALLLLILRIFTPEPTNWSASYSKNDKIPYGSYILFEELQQMFPGNRIETTNLPFYNITKQRKIDKKNILIICSYFNPDELDTKAIYELLNFGNDIFIAASGYGKIISDSLKIQNNISFFGGLDSTEINFVNPALKRNTDYKYSMGAYDHHFDIFDTAKVTVIGVNKSDYANFIKMKIGNGNLFLHTIPNVFTNYNLLKEDREYIFKSLSYLNNRDLIWDEYYKEVNKYQSTPLRYILSQPSLKWSYFTFLMGVVLFMIFKGKRDQRIIPLIKPLTNTTTEFIQTIGNVYLKQSNHKNIADKKIIYFLDHLRSRYATRVQELNDEIIQQISDKANIDISELNYISNLIKTIENSSSIKKDTLIELNNLLEKFYLNTGAYGK